MIRLIDERKTEEKNGRKWLILANVSIGTFMSTLDGSIANVALPTISSQLNAPLHEVQWVLTAYLLTICATLPIIGKFSDLFGRSRVYTIGLFIFTGGSLMCGLSHYLATLIISRIVQAIGASCIMTNSQGIVASTFAKGGRGKAMGITGTMVSLGSLTGPGIGGLLIEHFGWASIFLMNLPIGLIGFLAGWFILPKDKIKEKHEPFDYLGSVLFMVGMVSFLYTLSNAEVQGWGSLFVKMGMITAICSFVFFFSWERKTSFPMLDFSLYRIRAFAIGNMTALLSFIAIFCTNVMMPIYMENILHYSPELTGYTMMSYPLVMAVIAPISGWLSDKFGSHFLTTGGLLINALGFGLLTTLTQSESPWLVALHLSLFGIGHGLFQSPNNSSVMGAVPIQKLGSAGGLNALIRNVGMVLGTTFSVSLFSFRLHQLSGHLGSLSSHSTDQPEQMMNALHVVFWAAFTICLIGAILSSLRIWTRIHAKKVAI